MISHANIPAIPRRETSLDKIPSELYDISYFSFAEIERIPPL
jgi:hypothetical protein